MTERKKKVSEKIKQEVSEILQQDIKDPRIGFITITRVDVSADLKFARIFYSVLGDEKQKEDARQGLESAKKYTRKKLGERLTMRYTPEIAFRLDESAEYSIRIGKVFEQLEEERQEKEKEHPDD